MPFKINIADKTGKTYKLELENEELVGKSLHDKLSGKELLADLNDYEFEITGASDKSGFTAHKDVQGSGRKKLLLIYGKGMKKRPRKEGKKKVSNPKPKGLRLRKTVRGQMISPEITQINLKILKQGSKKLSEIFPDQNKPKEKPEEKKKEPVKKEETVEKIKGIEKEQPKEQTKEQIKKEIKESNKEPSKEPKTEEKSEEKIK